MSRSTSPRPIALPISPDRIPSELKASPQFVGWRYDFRDEKWTKPPICIQTGEHASSTNPQTWTTHEIAVFAYRNNTHELDGIGYVLSEHDEIVGFDFDHCRNPDTGEIDAWALELIHRLNSYTEVSPSGTGLRTWTRGTFVDAKQGRKRGDFEMYRGERYLTLTGCHLEGTPTTIEPRQEAIDAIYEQFFRRPEHPPDTPHTNGHTPTLDDATLLEKALNARNGGKLARLLAGDIRGYPSPSEADLALCNMFAFWTNDAIQIDRLVHGSALFREKWERADYRDATIAKALGNAREHWRGFSAGVTNGQSYGPHHRANGHAPASGTDEEFHLTDVGNGLRLVQQFGHDLRYVASWHKWLLWDGGRWLLDIGATVEWHAKQVIGELYRWAEHQIAQLANDVSTDEAAQKRREEELARVMATLKWAHTSETGTHIDLMVKRARVNPAVQVRHTDLDANPMLFHVLNGTVDLTTGTLLMPRRSDLITKQAPVLYDPDAVCPLWDQFLRRVQGYPQPGESLHPRDQDKRIVEADEMIPYLKRLVGMCLTADVTAQILLFLYGTGSNGKSTFLNQ